MICETCKRENSSDAEFCEFCGMMLPGVILDDPLFKIAIDALTNGESDAVSKLIKCAENGNSNGYFLLGNIFECGSATESIDDDRAYKYYQMALSMGNHHALLKLGVMCFCERPGIENRSKSFRYLSEYMHYFPNESEGAFELSRCYRDGIGTGKDLQKAKQLMEYAIQIQPDRSYFISSYANILLDEKNKECIKWYKKGVEMEDCWSAYKLGEIYMYGKITFQNIRLAIRYFQMALSFGDPDHEVDKETMELAREGLRFLGAETSSEQSSKKQSRSSKDVESVSSDEDFSEEEKVLLSSLQALESGALSVAYNGYLSVLNRIESLFFTTYIVGMQADCDSCVSAINNMRAVLSDIVSKIKIQVHGVKKQTDLCWYVAKYASKFVLQMCQIHHDEFNRMVAHRTPYTRLEPVVFNDQVMVPRYEEMAHMLYSLGDQIDRSFPGGEAKDASVFAWKYGGVPMELCTHYGSFREKIKRKELYAYYQSKVK